MGKQSAGPRIRRVDVQVSLFTALIVVVSCLTIFFIHYTTTYRSVIADLSARVYSIYDYLEDTLDKDSFSTLRSPGDMDSETYRHIRQTFADVKHATGVRYLYTATRNEDGAFIYLVDGLPLDAEDFRCPGDLIEPEIVPELERAMSNLPVMPDAIKDTDWGKIFISYLPIHDEASGTVVGVVGIEFEASLQYDTYRTLRLLTPLVILCACLISVLFAIFFFRRISNPLYRDLSNTDQLTQLKNRNSFSVDLDNISARGAEVDLGILLLDLNDLKLVNDTMGHNFGDLYLQAAAEALRASVQGHEVPYRIGGDEFAILIPHASAAHLEALCEQIRLYFSEHRPDWPVKTSFSMGWAIYAPHQDVNLQTTYHRADSMMYEQKRAYHQRSGNDRRR